MKRLTLGILALASAWSVAHEAHAYRRMASQWNPRNLPIRYLINRASIPPALGEAAGVAAIENGMASWSAPTCSAWRTTNAGNTTVTRGSASDRQNTFLWISNSWPAELGSVNVTIGVTTPVYQQGGYFIDADIQYNNVGFQWSTTGARGTVDAQSIATHEEGHFLGLDHTDVRAAVMYASYSGGINRALNADDLAGVCALYPTGAAIPDAGTPADPCNQYTSCGTCTPVNGCGWCGAQNRCVTSTQTGPVAGTCASGFAWTQNMCGTTTADAGTSTDPCSRWGTCTICAQYQGCGWCGAQGRCLTSTESGPVGGTCASGFAWYPNQCTAAPQDAGQPVDTGNGTMMPEPSGFGESCGQTQPCGSGGLCIGSGSIPFFCTRVCTDDCTCPRGYSCGATISTGQRVCIPGTNRCSEDAGIAPLQDSGNPVPPRDTGVSSDTGNNPVDSGNGPVDSGAGMDDAGLAEDTGSTGGSQDREPDGCGCSTVGTRSESRAPYLAALGFGLAAVVRRRRRR